MTGKKSIAFYIVVTTASFASLALVQNVLGQKTNFSDAFSDSDHILPPFFDVRDATIPDIHNALISQQVTCGEVISAFLARIEALNPAINALTSLNSLALTVASEYDSLLRSSNSSSSLPSLFCIPTILKDNFDFPPLPTTGGSLSLAQNFPSKDARSVTLLKNSGAIILAKSNLHELALEGLTVSSLGGQTLNPYDLTRTPGGSSGGTGAALAAGLAVLGTGTDTINSLRNPASANGVFSIRPTRGLVSKEGVMGVSASQDAVGPMARNVDDLARMLTVMAEPGGLGACGGSASADYAAGLHAGTLRGVRLGVVEPFFDRRGGVVESETVPVVTAMDASLSLIRSAGAELVSLNDATLNPTEMLHSLNVQQWEFRKELDSYLSAAARTSSARSFADLYCSGASFLVIPSQYGLVRAAAELEGSEPEYLSALERVESVRTALRKTFSRHGLDALVYPQQRNLVVHVGSPSQRGRNGILAAATGWPSVALPAGYSPPTQDAPVGVPVGMELLAPPCSEARLLNLAALVSRAIGSRRMPAMANVSLAASPHHPVAIPVVPARRPGTAQLPYPIGVL